MNTDVSDLLHESIDRLTDGARVPAGLADRAVRRNRQRQVTLGTAAATGTAVLATAAVLVATAVTGAAPRGGGTIPARTSAYVVNRTERALTVAQRENLIEEIHTVGHHYGLGLTQVNTFHFNGGTGRVIRQAGSTAAQEMIWSYRGQLRERGLDAAGRPVFDASSTTARSPAGPKSVLMKVSGVGVNYRAKTWWRSAVRLNLPASATSSACKNAYLPPPVGSTVELGRRNSRGIVLRALPHHRASADRHGPRHQTGLGETQWPLFRDPLGEPGDLPSDAASLALARSPWRRPGNPDGRLPVAPADRGQSGSPAGDGAARIPAGSHRRSAGPWHGLLTAGPPAPGALAGAGVPGRLSGGRRGPSSRHTQDPRPGGRPGRGPAAGTCRSSRRSRRWWSCPRPAPRPRPRRHPAAGRG